MTKLVLLVAWLGLSAGRPSLRQPRFVTRATQRPRTAPREEITTATLFSKWVDGVKIRRMGLELEYCSHQDSLPNLSNNSRPFCEMLGDQSRCWEIRAEFVAGCISTYGKCSERAWCAVNLKRKIDGTHHVNCNDYMVECPVILFIFLHLFFRVFLFLTICPVSALHVQVLLRD